MIGTALHWVNGPWKGKLAMALALVAESGSG